MRTFHLAQDIPKLSGLGKTSFTVQLDSDKLVPGDRIAPVNSIGHQLYIEDGPWVGDAYEYLVHLVTHNHDDFWPDDVGGKETEFRFVGRAFYSDRPTDWGPPYEQRFPDWRKELDKL